MGSYNPDKVMDILSTVLYYTRIGGQGKIDGYEYQHSEWAAILLVR